MKDLVGPGNVNIANCGRVIIRKVTDPSPDPTDTTFNYTTTGGLNPASFGLKNGESRDYGGAVQAGSYSVTETDPAPTFAFTNLNCSASETSDGTTITINGRTVSFNLAANDIVDCTYTNTLQVGALAIVKNSTKGGLVSTAGAVFSYDGSSVTDNGAGDEDPTIGEVCVSGLLPGDYDVTETSAPPGYGLPTDPGPETVTVVAGTNCTDNWICATSRSSSGVVVPNPKNSRYAGICSNSISVPTCVLQPRSCAARRNGVTAVFITTSPTNVVGATRLMSIGKGSPSFMPRGVAFTTTS